MVYLLFLPSDARLVYDFLFSVLRGFDAFVRSARKRKSVNPGRNLSGRPARSQKRVRLLPLAAPGILQAYDAPERSARSSHNSMIALRIKS